MNALGWTVSLQTLYVEALTPSLLYLEIGLLGGKVKLGHKGGILIQ